LVGNGARKPRALPWADEFEALGLADTTLAAAMAPAATHDAQRPARRASSA